VYHHSFLFAQDLIQDLIQDAGRIVTITHRGSKTTQGVVIYVVKTMETTGG